MHLSTLNLAFFVMTHAYVPIYSNYLCENWDLIKKGIVGIEIACYVRRRDRGEKDTLGMTRKDKLTGHSIGGRFQVQIRM